jgi:hypothetical protein
LLLALRFIFCFAAFERIIVMTIRYAHKPCDECPWRRDVPTGKFRPQRFRDLAESSYDMARMMFACHKSPEGREFICAGYLLQSSAHNLTLRLARQEFDVSNQDEIPLFATYRMMAIANGVKPSDPSLRNCRDDGQALFRNK